MKKKIFWIIFVIIFVATVIVVAKTFTPRSVADTEILEVVRVQANFNYGEENSMLEDGHFIPDKIIECLSQYKEQCTLVRNKGYAMKNVQMHITVRTRDGLKDIIIGKDTYSQKGSGPAYRILDEDKFKKDIFNVCGYIGKIKKDK